jgi:hypothetical protein
MKGSITLKKIPHNKKIIWEKIEGDAYYENSYFVLVPFRMENGKHQFNVLKVDEGFEISGELYIVSSEKVNKFKRDESKGIEEVEYTLHEEVLFEFLDHQRIENEIQIRTAPNRAIRRRYNLPYNPNYLIVMVDENGTPIEMKMYTEFIQILVENFIFTEEMREYITDYIVQNKLKLLFDSDK